MFIIRHMIFVYIDGQNFLYKAAHILLSNGKINDKQELYNLDIRGLIVKLLNTDEISIKYYGTKVRLFKVNPEIEQKTKIIIDSQRRLRNTLAKQKIAFIEAGKLKLRDGDICKNCGKVDIHLQEKGVDVRIAVDMMQDSQNGANHLVLISSDTDLLPPIHAVRQMGNKITYVGFSDKTTNALIQASSDLQIIRDQEIIDAFDRLNPNN